MHPDPHRHIHAITGIGMAAHVLQGSALEILRIRVDQPALILVDRGVKSVRTEGGAAVRALPGQAIVLDGGQSVDFTNSVTDGDHYEARWLLIDPALLDDAYYRSTVAKAAVAPKASVRCLAHVGDGLATAFERASETLAMATIPEPVARQRMLEVMYWLLEEGIVLHGATSGSSMSTRVRKLVAAALGDDWTADRVASELALSQATLRRRLASEGSSLTELLVDSRMATALTLLQATSQPVAHIALSVGYASPSRFAVRFRQRFGFAPTNGNLQPAMMRLMLLRRAGLAAGHPAPAAVQGRMERVMALLEQRLGETPYLAGTELTAADIMTVFTLTTMRLFQPWDLAPHPHVRAYLQRIGERPAYRRAMSISDPDLTPLLD